VPDRGRIDWSAPHAEPDRVTMTPLPATLAEVAAACRIRGDSTTEAARDAARESLWFTIRSVLVRRHRRLSPVDAALTAFVSSFAIAAREAFLLTDWRLLVREEVPRSRPCVA